MGVPDSTICRALFYSVALSNGLLTFVAVPFMGIENCLQVLSLLEQCGLILTLSQTACNCF